MIVIRMLLFLVFALSLLGQELNTAWQSYVTTNANIARLETERSIYQQEQEVIKKEVETLQSGSAWYNAWLNKYLLTRHISRQLVVLDSLKAIEEELSNLQILQGQEMQTMKSAYARVLEEYEKGVLPSEQNIQNMQPARFRSIIKSTPVLFPDYKNLLNMEWQNPEQRRLLLRDVRRLLDLKIDELDSIHTVREEEAELALRLADFHADMGLHMEADQDAQIRDASGNTEKALGWGFMDASNSPTSGEFANEGGRNEVLDMVVAPSNLTNINVQRDDLREVSQEQMSGSDLNYLEEKISEYKTLLETINQELGQSP